MAVAKCSANICSRVYRQTVATVAAAVMLGGAAIAYGQAHLPLSERSGVFPDGQQWQITVPANWNGTVINDLDRIGNNSRANFFLPRGYAYTGTRRHPDRDTNWNPQAESNNMVKVLDLFEGEFGRPVRTIQFGCSGGGSVALSVAEDHPARFDGVVAMHATSPVTLENMRLDLTFALKALLDANNQLPLIVGDAGIAAAEKLWIAALTAAQTTPEGRARMALAGVLAQYPIWGSNYTPHPAKPDPNDPAAVQQALLRAVLDGARRAVTSRPQWDNPAGLMSWNTGVDYREFYKNADPRHKQVVRDMYAQAGLHIQRDIDADLDRINAAPRIAATAEAVNYWRARTHTGIIGVPMLHISNIGDAGTPAANMSSYEDSVRKAGRNALYRQAFIDASGHCTFNTAEMGAAVETMVRRINSGRWSNLANPEQMNAVGLSFGLAQPRYIRDGVPAGWSLPNNLNRAFFPDSAGPESQ
jgi:pimeloyl-ACP methyl ester carboxylesterase